jgi:hypothetical protein
MSERDELSLPLPESIVVLIAERAAEIVRQGVRPCELFVSGGVGGRSLPVGSGGRRAPAVKAPARL